MAYGNGDGKSRNLYEKSAKALNPQAVNNCYNKDMRIKFPRFRISVGTYFFISAVEIFPCFVKFNYAGEAAKTKIHRGGLNSVRV